MSQKYVEYLKDHISGVQEAYKWLEKNFPDKIEKLMQGHQYVIAIHDTSKYGRDEFDAYDAYFYGPSKSHKVVKKFKYAWLNHIHGNPHHWQYWILNNDDDGEEILDMPTWYIVEMVCDWWSFSWNKGDYKEIFDWYEKHKDKMKLSDKTRKTLEELMDLIKTKISSKDEAYSNQEAASISHYGIAGQKWGVLNGPPYPIGSNLKNRTKAQVEKLENYTGKLYWISEENMDGKQINPRIPDNFFTKNDYEDNTTKRLCFAPSVDKCLIALSQNLNGKVFSVYEPSEMPNAIYKPNKGAVPDSEITGEMWVKEPVTLVKSGEIRVTGDDGKDGIKFEYGDGETAELYGWNFEWVK